MLRNSLIILMILAIALPAGAFNTGDPIDGNDRPATSLTTPGCDDAERFPYCEPCWTTCIYAIMAQAWTDGWDDNDW